jgi:hypothetical protein
MDTPFEIQEFSTQTAAFAALKAFSLSHGFEISRCDRKTSSPGRIRETYWCRKSGVYDNKGKGDSDVKQRHKTASMKEGCPWRAEIRLQNSVWTTTTVSSKSMHSHQSTIPSALSSHRISSLEAEEIREILELAKSGLGPAMILSKLRLHDHERTVLLTPKDISNIIQGDRAKKLGERTPTQWLLDELQHQGFAVSYTQHSSGHLQRLFYAHPASVALWKKHPDLLLLDSTYKTNRFRMPLLNIGGVTGNNKTIQIAVAFLNAEKEEDYTWAMGCLRKVMINHAIEEPSVVITDRELALMNALDASFLSSKHILCQWHINKNVQIKTKRDFPTLPPGSLPGACDPKHNDFIDEWTLLLKSTTSQEYHQRKIEFERPNKHPTKAVKYAVKTWLTWKEKLVSFWVDQYPHFNNKTTSRLEGLHAVLKKYIQVSTGK